MNMNMMTQFNHNQNSITSLDISELVQSELRAVNLSIERLAKRGVIQLPPMVKVENKQSLSPNKYTSVYIFSGEQGKLDSITVVAQLCPEFTAALVKRWYELENQNAVQLPQPCLWHYRYLVCGIPTYWNDAFPHTGLMLYKAFHVQP